jgi:hypothetical protein
MQRKIQQEFRAKPVFGHKVNAKAANLIAKMSDGQLRTMFPQFAHMDSSSLRREALKAEIERMG